MDNLYQKLRDSLLHYKSMHGHGAYSDLAGKSGVSIQTISKIANGLIKKPRLDYWIKLHQAAPNEIPEPLSSFEGVTIEKATSTSSTSGTVPGPPSDHPWACVVEGKKARTPLTKNEDLVPALAAQITEEACSALGLHLPAQAQKQVAATVERLLAAQLQSLKDEIKSLLTALRPGK